MEQPVSYPQLPIKLQKNSHLAMAWLTIVRASLFLSGGFYIIVVVDHADFNVEPLNEVSKGGVSGLFAIFNQRRGH